MVARTPGTAYVPSKEVVMGAIEGKIFKSGDDVAVLLPREFGFEPGAPVTLVKSGSWVTIRPVEDPEKVRRGLAQMAAEIDAIWEAAGGSPPPEVRDPDIFPDRPGLY